MSPPEFMGEYDPSKTREWIQRMSGILESMECSEVDKVNFVTRSFRGDACHWWESTKAYMTANFVDMNWTNIRRLFIDHYIPESYQLQMERALNELKQGGMTVAEYTMRFNELVRYVADGNDAPTEAWKMKKYRFGLRADIAHDVAMQNVTSFSEMVQKSYHAEASLKDIQKERGEVLQRRKETGKFNFQLKTKGSSSKEKHNYSPRSPRKCPECGSHHSRKCMKGQGICYYCR
jgi:hypothetical protein